MFDRPLWDPLKEHGSYIRSYESTDHLLMLLSRIMEAYENKSLKSRLNALDDSRSLSDLIKREVRLVDKKPHPHAEKLNYLVSKIQLAPEEAWTVPKMAKNLNLSSRSLNRLFHREYGMGPMDFVIRRRLDMAIEMLIYTDDKIEAIASSISYKSLNSFSNLFFRHIGMRPGELRTKYCSEK